MEGTLKSSVLRRMLRVGESTLSVWRHRGVGPDFYRVGRSVRYRCADVESWLKEGPYVCAGCGRSVGVGSDGHARGCGCDG